MQQADTVEYASARGTQRVRVPWLLGTLYLLLGLAWMFLLYGFMPRIDDVLGDFDVEVGFFTGAALSVGRLALAAGPVAGMTAVMALTLGAVAGLVLLSSFLDGRARRRAMRLAAVVWVLLLSIGVVMVLFMAFAFITLFESVSGQT